MKLEDLIKFSDGVRMIMILQRGKEGGVKDEPQHSAHKKITTNTDEFFKVLDEFKDIKSKSKLPLRIYSCVNKRSIKKAIREFKTRQLDIDYADEREHKLFYLDIKNRWISCLMKPSCREETFFLIDIDDNKVVSIADTIIYAKRKLEELDIKIICTYLTKNGSHIITKPFNPALWDNDLGEIKKDGLLLLDY